MTIMSVKYVEVPMNCAWCGSENDGSDSHGICDKCMSKYFGVNPSTLSQRQGSNECDSLNGLGNPKLTLKLGDKPFQDVFFAAWTVQNVPSIHARSKPCQTNKVQDEIKCPQSLRRRETLLPVRI